MIKKLLNNQDGFTMVESLIVLVVIVLFAQLSIVSIGKFYQRVEKNLFFDQLKTDIYYAKARAINEKSSMIFEFFPQLNKYEVYMYQDEQRIVREFPDKVRIKRTNLQRIYFRETGTMSSFGTVTFDYDGKEIKLIFNIGQGRFYVEE